MPIACGGDLEGSAETETRRLPRAILCLLEWTELTFLLNVLSLQIPQGVAELRYACPWCAIGRDNSSQGESLWQNRMEGPDCCSRSLVFAERIDHLTKMHGPQLKAPLLQGRPPILLPRAYSEKRTMMSVPLFLPWKSSMAITCCIDTVSEYVYPDIPNTSVVEPISPVITDLVLAQRTTSTSEVSGLRLQTCCIVCMALRSIDKRKLHSHRASAGAV